MSVSVEYITLLLDTLRTSNTKCMCIANEVWYMYVVPVPPVILATTVK